jgi:protein tyrosine/serine phosphatase
MITKCGSVLLLLTTGTRFRACVVVLAGLLTLGVGACSSDDENVNLDVMNFHAIEEGQAYRSAQPRERELRHIIDEYGIKTVINLRGENKGKSWYDMEVAVCQDRDVAHEDIRMSSQSLPSPDELSDLVTTLKTAQRPILMHCQGGADRSGLAAAMYRLVVEGKSKDEALAELDGRFGHIDDRKPCMTKFIRIYEPTESWLDEYEQTYEQIECGEGEERRGEGETPAAAGEL